MIFWIGILVGGAFIWLALRMGFLEVWTMLFNIVISVYTAVFSTSTLMDLIPAASGTAYGCCFTMAAIGIGTFLILSGISYTFLTAMFKVTFPKILDQLGAGILGFLSGLLMWSFLVLIITVSPLSKKVIAGQINLSDEEQKTHVRYVAWWCDNISIIVSPSKNTVPTSRMIAQMIQDVQDMKTKDKLNSNDPNEPVDQNQPHQNLTKRKDNLLRNITENY